MRELIPSDKNETRVMDQPSGTVITYYYRMPLSSDRIKYKSLVVNTLTETSSVEAVEQKANEFVLDFITGFQDGCFTINGKPISSDEKSKDYYPGWKAVIKDHAYDHLSNIRIMLFDESSYILKKNFPSSTNLNQQKMPGLKKRKKNT